MEIIECGNLKKPETTKIFKCHSCGCEFKADKDEYKATQGRYNEYVYYCKCPICGENTYHEK